MGDGDRWTKMLTPNDSDISRALGHQRVGSKRDPFGRQELRVVIDTSDVLRAVMESIRCDRVKWHAVCSGFVVEPGNDSQPQGSL